MPAFLREYEVSFDDNPSLWSRNQRDGLPYRVRITLDADDEFLSRLRDFFDAQVQGSTTIIRGPARLQDNPRRIDPTPPALPPGPIEGEFIDDGKPKRRR